ncbi:unnamed protein product [Clonostachys rosea]|uniref:Uncharacterized protein n=1 Tax=Bionectria ochroleuca TaxID=29856 RepID=A0ABY6TZF6_BIOOC|nr:unnamed protein product [Clonostachys rosea]
MRQARRIEISPGPQPYGLIWMLSGSLEVQEANPEGFFRFLHPETDWSNVVTIEGDLAKGINSLPSRLPPARDPSEVDIRIHGAKAFANYGLPHLTDLYLNFDNENNRLVDLAAIKLLFGHPSLEILRLSNINWLTEGIEEMEYYVKENKIHTIDLRNSAVNAFSIRHILTSFSSLRYLSVELHDIHVWKLHADVDGNVFPVEYSWEYDSADFGPVLTKHGQSLVELRLETWQYCDYQWERNLRTLGSLTRIPLRKLEIELQELVSGAKNLGNHEIEVLMRRLPLELEELTILDQEKDILTGIRSFLLSCMGRSLRVVNLEMIDSSPVDEGDTEEIDGWIMKKDYRYTRTAAGNDLILYVSFVKFGFPHSTHSETKPTLVVGQEGVVH